MSKPASVPCPFCGAAMGRCPECNWHLRCGSCKRNVCYWFNGAQLKAGECRGLAPLKNCPKCEGALVDGGCGKSFHRTCSTCGRCYTRNNTVADCKPRPKVCHHCGGTGREPEVPSVVPEKRQPRKRFDA